LSEPHEASSTLVPDDPNQLQASKFNDAAPMWVFRRLGTKSIRPLHQVQNNEDKKVSSIESGHYGSITN
jgi:hypothetical protein